MFAPRLLGSDDAGELDRAAAQNGVSGRRLMAAAARAVTREITRDFAPCRVCVLCGPGNNGGDGLLVAHRLRRAGWPVRVASLPGWRGRRGDAGWAQRVWGQPESTLAEAREFDLLVDAAFGAGLNRPLDDDTANFLRRAAEGGVPLVAIDVASGVNGTTGEVDGRAIRARKTVTFVRPKLGHALLPGRLAGGDLVVADIGIGGDLLARIAPTTRLNSPAIWAHLLPQRAAAANKYDAGHAVVLGGPAGRTGAALMSAMAADKAGAGLVTLGCRPEDAPSYESRLLEVMLRSVDSPADLAAWLADRRISAVALGPAFGISKARAGWLQVCLEAGKPLVLDADAITLLADDRATLTGRLPQGTILTPHDGEFARLSDARGSRLERARAAAADLGAIVVLKGGDTVVAAPSGEAVITTHAPPCLARAGSGDVLCGIVLGLLAQGMAAFAAACAGVWLHGEAARGPLAPRPSEIVTTDAFDRALTRARSFPIAEPPESP